MEYEVTPGVPRHIGRLRSKAKMPYSILTFAVKSPIHEGGGAEERVAGQKELDDPLSFLWSTPLDRFSLPAVIFLLDVRTRTKGIPKRVAKREKTLARPHKKLPNL